MAAKGIPAKLLKQLDQVMGWAVSPTDGRVEWDKIVAFCVDVRKSIASIQAVMDTLASKMHSTSNTIAISALTMLESVVKSCGPPAHTIVGRFKFLNELIKICNPKFNSPASAQMKQRVLSAMRQWATSLPQKTKIREAVDMLIAQGVRMPPDPQPVPQVPTGPGYLDAPAVIMASAARQSQPPAPKAASPVLAPPAAAAPAAAVSLLDFDTPPAPSIQNPTFSHHGSLNGSQQDLARGGGAASADPFDLGDLFAPKPKKDNGHYEDDRSLSSFAGSEWSMDPGGQDPVSAGRPTVVGALGSMAGGMLRRLSDKVSEFSGLDPLAELDEIAPSPSWHEGYILIGKRETEELLMGHASGAYLIRESSTAAGTYALAVRDDTAVEHFRICTERGQLYIAGSANRFKKLDELVAFYQGMDRGDLPVQLNDGIYGMYRTPAHEEPVVSPELVTPTLDAAKPPDADDADAEVWELARKDMLLGNVLGVGHFGKVCMAKLRVPWGGEIDVAVKMAKADRMTSQAFLGEASKLKKLQHRNIVRVYGLCTSEDPIFIVFEYTAGGSLFDFLQSRKGSKLGLLAQTAMLRDVAAGMAFLERSHWVHADLAARNCLVGAKSEVKICDFGHAIKTNDANDPVRNAITIPIRWSAPEFFDTIHCSPATDVWSFAIVVYEVFLRGAVPYPEMDNALTGHDNKTLIAMLMAGYRMARPRKIPVYYYSMMLDCMQHDAANRPTFARLLEIFGGLVSSAKLKEAGAALVDGTGASHGYQFTGPPYDRLDREEVRETAGKTIKAWHATAEANTKQRSREMARSMKENKKNKGKRGTSKGLAAIYDEPDWTRKVDVNGGAPGAAADVDSPPEVTEGRR